MPKSQSWNTVKASFQEMVVGFLMFGRRFVLLGCLMIESFHHIYDNNNVNVSKQQYVDFAVHVRYGLDSVQFQNVMTFQN